MRIIPRSKGCIFQFKVGDKVTRDDGSYLSLFKFKYGIGLIISEINIKEKYVSFINDRGESEGYASIHEDLNTFFGWKYYKKIENENTVYSKSWRGLFKRFNLSWFKVRLWN